MGSSSATSGKQNIKNQRSLGRDLDAEPVKSTFKNSVGKKPQSYREYYDYRIEFWKRFSMTMGMIVFVGIFIINMSESIFGSNGDYSISNTAFGYFFIFLALPWGIAFHASLFLSWLCLVMITILSFRRKQHLLKDYIVAIVGILLAFSPLRSSPCRKIR